MPIPSFKDTLAGTLAPGITIVQGGDYFNNDDDIKGLTISQMNKELAGTTKEDDIVFITSEPEKEDFSFRFFLDSQKSSKK